MLYFVCLLYHVYLRSWPRFIIMMRFQHDHWLVFCICIHYVDYHYVLLIPLYTWAMLPIFSGGWLKIPFFVNIYMFMHSFVGKCQISKHVLFIKCPLCGSTVQLLYQMPYGTDIYSLTESKVLDTRMWMSRANSPQIWQFTLVILYIFRRK